MAGEKFLKCMGFDTYSQTTGRVKINENKISHLPHKTVATRAGLDWKNCPSQALKGTLWSVGTARDQIMDIEKMLPKTGSADVS